MQEEKNPWNKNHLWLDEIALLSDIIAKTPLQEAKKWGGIVYVFNNKNIIGVGGFKNYFALWFFNGAFLKDASQVLIAATNTTKALRQWRFTSKEQINEKLILQYIYEAIANEEKGISFKPQKNSSIESSFMNCEMENDSILHTAFQQFSPYKQKEFLEYIETAKQEKTKISRFEKIKPMILSGIGLNDKYRK